MVGTVKDVGYLHFGKGTQGPFKTVEVALKQDVWPNAHRWLARYEGKWRVVHVQVKRTYIVVYGEKIDIEIWGV